MRARRGAQTQRFRLWLLGLRPEAPSRRRRSPLAATAGGVQRPKQQNRIQKGSRGRAPGTRRESKISESQQTHRSTHAGVTQALHLSLRAEKGAESQFSRTSHAQDVTST